MAALGGDPWRHLSSGQPSVQWAKQFRLEVPEIARARWSMWPSLGVTVSLATTIRWGGGGSEILMTTRGSLCWPPIGRPVRWRDSSSERLGPTVMMTRRRKVINGPQAEAGLLNTRHWPAARSHGRRNVVAGDERERDTDGRSVSEAAAVKKVEERGRSIGGHQTNARDLQIKRVGLCTRSHTLCHWPLATTGANCVINGDTCLVSARLIQSGASFHSILAN